ncbi:MAG: hypothetical protein V7633_2746 [Pseudonocardia sp.]|jgi:hypothetical protein
MSEGRRIRSPARRPTRTRGPPPPMHRPRHRRLAAVSAAFGLATILGLVGTALALEDRSCTAFAYQEDAQTALTAALTAPSPDAERAAQLDRDGNGRACETLPHRDLAQAAALVRAASVATNTTPPASAAPAVVRPSPEPVRATAGDCAPTSAVPPTGRRDGSAQGDDAASAVGHGEPHAGSGCPQSPTQLAAGAP